ncbi:Transposon Ty3-G Gag-Pol polyprotein [Trichinella nativa]|uniref:RNA-directed DNA polymerase n=1 Tax=Trichinella nativa TaxID=6335 RepID=A0A0V1LQU7_9BILA|nr:Transposon Ty3-G Gag-Pol polyprotein [Trichinella nativa]
MDPVEWLESMEDFSIVTGVQSSQQAARLSVNIAVRRELFPPGSPLDISWGELKRRFLDIYGHGESLIQLAEVAELGRRAGKSESELVARFICGVASKEVHRELSLREATTLVKARQLAENAAELETEVGGSRQRTTENADAGNDNLAQVVETLTRRFDQLQTTLERSNSRRSARRGMECFRCGEQGHFLRDCPQLQTGTRPARALNNGNGDRRLLAMTALQAGHAPSVAVPLSIWHNSTGREPLEAAGGSILLADEDVDAAGILGTNFLDQYVKLIDWQSVEMTMTDGSRVQIVHELAQATRPGIGCAWITASPREVSREEIVGERPENNSGELRACERALVDRAECSAQNQRTLRILLRRYGKAISCGEGDLGRTSLVQHRIETGGAQPVKLPPRRLPQAQRETVDRLIREMLHAGVIEPASGPWSSPVVLVRKKDGSPRFCVDYRKLNAVTRIDAQPIPRIDDTLDALAGAKWFSTLDLASGYWQVEVAEEDREKTAFSTPPVLFQFRVMPFGLCNAPATFQRLMENALKGLMWKTTLGRGAVPPTVSGAEDQAREVPTNAAECTLPAPRRNAARDWYRPREDSSCPKVAHDPMREGGVVNPLHELTKKGEKWQWGPKEEEPFTRLKEALVSPLILGHPDFDRTFLLDVDASEDAVRAVLSQQGGQDPPGVIAYASRSLSRAERGYCATRREMLALVWATQHFRPYLYDHNSLRWLRNFREPEGQVARWLERLAEFDFEVVHRAGQRHQIADALLRRVCKQCGLEGSPAEVPVGAVKLDAANPIKQWQESDKELQQIREWSTQRTWPQVAPEGSRLLRSLWSHGNRIVVHEGTICQKWETPDTGETRLLQVIPRQRIPEILAAVHNRQSRAHLGVAKKLAKLRQRYYWPQQREDVEDWCRACQTWAARAVPTKKPQAPMQLQAVGYPFQRVGMDIVGPPEGTRNGNRYILVVCDYFSKWPEAFALPNAEGRTVAGALVNDLYCRYGSPETLHSDQGRNFESELVKEVCQLFRVAETRTTAYHPQSDVLVERMKRTLLGLLAKASIDHPDDWDAHIDRVLLPYRQEMRFPVELVYGLPKSATEESVGEYTRRLRQDLEQLYEAVRGRAGREQRRQKFWKDRKSHGPVYEPGDQVWMHVPEKTKLGAYWDGPYEVQKKLDGNTYRVKEMKGRRRRLVVHFDRLKPYHATSEREGARGRQRERRKTRRPSWLQDFIQTQEVSTGRALHEGESSAADMDRVNEISPAEYGSCCLRVYEELASCQKVCVCVFVDISSSVFVSVNLIFYCLLRFIVAMPSGKREKEKKGNTPVNTGPSPNSDGRANTQVEEADEPARGSGPLHFKLYNLNHE